MVTMVNAASGAGSWDGTASASYICNTNGPYCFSNISALAVSGRRPVGGQPYGRQLSLAAVPSTDL